MRPPVLCASVSVEQTRQRPTTVSQRFSQNAFDGAMEQILQIPRGIFVCDLIQLACAENLAIIAQGY
jgi:hypothetical protein